MAIEAQALLRELRERYPDKEFEIDAISGKIGFVIEGMFITDPWLSDCGRFTVMPNKEYGVRIVDACKMKAFNLPIEDAEQVEFERAYLLGEWP